MKSLITLILVATLVSLHAKAADTLFVNAIAEPGSDGQSWEAPYRTIMEAVGAAEAGDEIWVAQGTYRIPSPLTPKNGVSIFGGFVGNESLREMRDWYRYPSVLQPAGISSTIMTLVDFDSTARIDGLVFENATNSAVMINGGAPAFYNCHFRNNTGLLGGGIHANNVGRLRLEYCVFKDNESIGNGGGVYIDGCNGNVGPFGPFVGQCLFDGNNGELGGGLFISNCEGTFQISSSVFHANQADAGGGLTSVNVYTYITNSTFFKNSTTEKVVGLGRSIRVNGAHLQNSIFYTGDFEDTTEQVVVINSPINDTATIVSRANLVERDWDLGFWQNDPWFEDPDDVYGPDGFFGTDDDGLRVQWSSPVRDGGVIDGFVNHQNTDAIGNPRLVGRKNDVGAYEHQRQGRLSPPEIMALLREGGLVLYFRHTKTDWAQNDRGPSPECFPGRNLILEGRDQAREIGKAMRAMGVPTGEGNSSPVCRCWETLDLMLGYYETRSHWAGGGGDAIMAARLEELQTPPTTGNRIISSHDAVANMVFNPRGTGSIMTTAELHEGDALMVQPLGDTMEVLAQWTSDTWERYHVRFPDEVVSVDEEVIERESTLRVWPTPAATTINVESNTPGRIAISSMTGSTVMTVMVDGLEIIPIDSLAPGVYALRHENGSSAMFVVR